jgi:hypothetical protein
MRFTVDCVLRGRKLLDRDFEPYYTNTVCMYMTCRPYVTSKWAYESLAMTVNSIVAVVFSTLNLALTFHFCGPYLNGGAVEGIPSSLLKGVIHRHSSLSAGHRFCQNGTTLPLIEHGSLYSSKYPCQEDTMAENWSCLLFSFCGHSTGHDKLASDQ